MNTPEYELGQKLHVYGLNYWELLHWFLFFVAPFFAPILIVLLMLFLGEDARVAVAVYSLVIIAFFLVIVYHQLSPHRLIIYEKGIASQAGKQIRWWRWEEITKMTGTRHTYYVNGIPLYRYGENNFFAGGEAAFDVTWWTAEPNRAVQFIFMKMAEREMPTYIQAFQRGRTIRSGSLFMDRNQVGNQGSIFSWADIERYHWKGKTLSVVSRSRGRELKLGDVEPPELYFMMGVMDATHGTQTYLQYQMNYLKGPARWLGIERHFVLTIVGVIALILLLVGGLGIARFLIIQHEEQARNQLAAQYGSNTFAACANAHDKNNKGSTATSDHKYIVVNTDQGININTAFQGALDKADVADSKAELTAIICLKQQNAEIETCPYGGSEQKAKFYIARYQSVYLVSLVDVQTGKTFASTVIAGDMPAECPEKVKSSEARDIYGPLPTPGKLASFLERVKSSPSPENSA